MSVELEKDPLCGLTLGDYVIEEAVGMGGMGIVYRAVHPLIGRKVAVKVLRPEIANDPEQAERFLKEAQALSAVKHRGVIDIISFGKLPDGRQYMVMEFLEGEALDAVLAREHQLSAPRALGLIDEVLDALSAAHRAGVVHRDIKPANVFILTQSNGTKVVKVVDFGLARKASLANLERHGDRTSLMAGTPEYFSPEQARGLAATPRSDLYALGVMLYELISGQLPFTSDSVVALLEAHQKRPAPRLSSVVGGLPDTLVDLVDQLLAKNPEDRPQSADAARTTVQRVLRELRTQETQIGAMPAAARRSREHAAAASGGRGLVTRKTGEKPAHAPAPPPPQHGTEPDPLPAAPAQTQALASRWPRSVLIAALISLIGALLFALTRPQPVNLPQEPVADAEPAPPREPTPVVARPQPEPSPPPPKPVVEAPPADDLEPLTGLPKRHPPKPTGVKVRPTPTSVAPVPPICSESTWVETLKSQVREGEQNARAQKRLTAEAEGSLRAIYVALRDGKKDCATLSRDLDQWRREFTPR